MRSSPGPELNAHHAVEGPQDEARVARLARHYDIADDPPDKPFLRKMILRLPRAM